ncbi:MAG TPA: hypothetical protein VFU98_08180, partial [Microlunatus sp.]|nr:hypothetical protein [Microlunatus sp.]
LVLGWWVAFDLVEAAMVVPVDPGGDHELDVVDTAPASTAQDRVAEDSALNDEITLSAMTMISLRATVRPHRGCP